MNLWELAKNEARKTTVGDVALIGAEIVAPETTHRFLGALHVGKMVGLGLGALVLYKAVAR